MEYEFEGIIFVTDEDEMPELGIYFSIEGQKQLYGFHRNENGEIIGKKVFSDLELKLLKKGEKRMEEREMSPCFWWAHEERRQRRELEMDLGG